MNEELANFLRLIDGHTYMEVILRTGDRVNLLGYHRTELMAPGNTVEEDLEHGRKAIDFLKGLISKFEAELEPSHILDTREAFGDDVSF
jgi:hypothetical protein